MRKFLWIFFVCICQLSFGQKYDYRWILGFVGTPGLTGNTDIVFTDSSADTINSHRNATMQNSQTTISDSSGNLLFYTNGDRIYNRNDRIMQNGDSLNYGAAWDQYYGGLAYNAVEDMVGLPTDTTGVWNLIHYYEEYTYLASPFLYTWRIEQTRIDMRGDNGLGTVVFKNKVLVQDTLGTYVTACQHGNGRDWWVLASKSSSNCLYTLLVQPDTIIEYPLQCLGSNYLSGDEGQAAFSPDGSKFAWVANYGGINVYDFDRCTGLLSNPKHLDYHITGNQSFQFGLSISPNSRFLYVAQSYCIFQFDLTADSISTNVDTIGHIVTPPDNSELTGYYFLMQLAPDGKIVISASNSEHQLHVINQPDKKGDSCSFVNYAFPICYNNTFGLPSYPGNYRLGALHGSSCDTLTKTDTTSVAIAKINREKILKVYPNPATDYAVVDYGFTDWSTGTSVSMEITDAIGRVVCTQSLPAYSGFQKLDVSKFASGLYNVAIKRSGATVATAKLVKE